MGEGDEGRGSRRICVLNPGMFFFFSFLLFLQTFMYRNYSYGHHQHHAQQPRLLPPPRYGVKEVGMKEVGVKGVQTTPLFGAPGISTCTGSLISVE